MPRFVLLRHDCPPSFSKPSHWDLMLERDGALWTWSLAELPPSWRQSEDVGTGSAKAESFPALRLPDHRLAYLDYEGAVSHDRGHVRRHDRGEYCAIEIADGVLRLELLGELVRGRLHLEKTGDETWRLRFV